MIPAPHPPDEAERLEALRRYAVLDTGPEERFDRITRLAARLLGVPICLVSLVDRDRQWFKSRVGLAACETSRDTAFCAHAILDDRPLVVLDAREDPRFQGNPLVTGAPHIRFYAGAPLVVASGHRLGTLCAISDVPRREFTPDEEAILRDLAAVAIDALELRHAAESAQAELAERQRVEDDLRTALALADRSRQAAEAAAKGLAALDQGLARGIRLPVNGLNGTVKLMQSTPLTAEQRDYVDAFEATAAELSKAVDRLLEEAKPAPLPRFPLRAAAPGPAPLTAPPPPPPVVVEPEAPLLAEDALAELLDAVGGPTLRDLLCSMVQNTTDALAGLEAARRQGNLEGIWRRAHEVVSVTGSFGLTRLSETARALEQAAKARDTAQVATLAGRMEGCWAASQAALDAFARARGLAP